MTGLLGRREAGAPQRRQRVLEPGHGVGRQRRPGHGGVGGPGVSAHRPHGAPGPGLEPLAPVTRRGRLGHPADGRVDHQREQLLLGRHVAVQRHRAGAELLGHAVHRHRLETLRVGDRRRRGDDPLQAQPGLGALGGRRLDPPTPRRFRESDLTVGHIAYTLRSSAYGIRKRLLVWSRDMTELAVEAVGLRSPTADVRVLAASTCG